MNTFEINIYRRKTKKKKKHNNSVNPIELLGFARNPYGNTGERHNFVLFAEHPEIMYYLQRLRIVVVFALYLQAYNAGTIELLFFFSFLSDPLFNITYRGTLRGRERDGLGIQKTNDVRTILIADDHKLLRPRRRHRFQTTVCSTSVIYTQK